MFLKLYSIALPVFVALDLAWLGLVARRFYQDQIGHLLRTEINWVAAFAFYLVFLAGLVFFVIRPAVRRGSTSDALLHGAFFGLVTYAAYDLTNLAVAKDWTLLVTVVDMAWGAALGAGVAFMTFFLAGRISLRNSQRR